MNDGYLFFIGLWIILILWVTGWLDFLFPRAVSVRRRKWFFALLLMIFLLQNWTVTLSPNVQVQAGTGIVLTLFLVYCYYADKSPYGTQMLAVSLFLGLLYAFVWQMFMMDPILMILPPLYLLPSLMIVLLLLTTHPMFQQMWMYASGLLLGDVLHQLLVFRYTGVVLIGGAHVRDQLLLGLALLMAAYFSFSYAWHIIRTTYQSRRLRTKEGG